MNDKGAKKATTMEALDTAAERGGMRSGRDDVATTPASSRDAGTGAGAGFRHRPAASGSRSPVAVAPVSNDADLEAGVGERRAENNGVDEGAEGKAPDVVHGFSRHVSIVVVNQF